LRVELGRRGERVSLVVADAQGELVAAVGGLQVRRATAEQVRAATSPAAQHLYRVAVVPVALGEAAAATDVVVVGGDGEVARALGGRHVASLDELSTVEGTPAHVIVDRTLAEATTVAAVHEATREALALVQRWV